MTPASKLAFFGSICYLCILEKRFLAIWLVALTALAAPLPVRPADPSPKPVRTADFRAEIGTDSLERRYYRPTFRFSFPVPGSPAWRWNAGLMYDQRMNGSLRGATDFWLSAGIERRLLGDRTQAEEPAALRPARPDVPVRRRRGLEFQA